MKSGNELSCRPYYNVVEEAENHQKHDVIAVENHKKQGMEQIGKSPESAGSSTGGSEKGRKEVVCFSTACLLKL
jgi:hypothetical protein